MWEHHNISKILRQGILILREVSLIIEILIQNTLLNWRSTTSYLFHSVSTAPQNKQSCHLFWTNKKIYSHPVSSLGKWWWPRGRWVQGWPTCWGCWAGGGTWRADRRRRAARGTVPSTGKINSWMKIFNRRYELYPQP